MALSFSSLLNAASNVKVTIEGINGELLVNAQLLMTIVRESETKKEVKEELWEKTTIQRYHRLAENEIKQALQPYGYYQPDIKSTLLEQELTRDRDKISTEANTKLNSVDEDTLWLAQYLIDKGPQSVYRHVSITVNGEGEKEPAVLSVINKSSIKVGSAVQHKGYDSLKQSLFDVLFEAGYLDVQFVTSQLLIDPSQSAAEVQLVVETGPRYYFGDIVIEQDILAPELLEKYISIDENMPFDSDALLDLQLSLNDSGYFSRVDIDVQRQNTHEQRIPVVINTVPTDKYRYKTSAGYGTDTGARIGFGLLNRRVNDYGHRLESELRLSEVESNISTQYKIPTGDVKTEYIDITAKANREDINEVVTTQYSIGAGINQNRWGGRRKLSLNLIEEQFMFDGDPSQSASLLVPGITYTYKKTDNPLFSRKGYSFLIDVHGSVESPVSEVSFLQARFNGRTVTPLSPKSRLLGRVELAATTTDDFSELPPSERFFTGGAQSVRGFGFKDIGARNAAGTNLGGQYLFTASVEADRLIWGNSGLAMFYDVGDAAASTDFSLKQAVGIGFRYRSPVGMIRIDVAHPYNDPNENLRLHFSIGPDL